MRYWVRYWWRVAKRAGADTARFAEPHKWLYATGVTVVGALAGVWFFGLPDAGDWWKIAAAALLANALGFVVVYSLQFVAAPARLDRERAVELDGLRWQRSETYAAMSRIVDDIDRLSRLLDSRGPAVWQEFIVGYSAVFGAVRDLRPQIKEHDFFGLLPSGENPEALQLPSEQRRALARLRDGIVALMERYQ